MEKGSSSLSSSTGANGGPGSPGGLSLGLQPKTSGGPARKGRGGLMQRCQVEGCKADLSDAKAYYSRHRVCGVHSKTPKVIVAGIEQRFCQQCSRFHQLPEFDQGKRSCRRRLAGHNERRRKAPQGCKNLLPSVFDNNHMSKTGSFVMDFSNYPSFLTGRDPFPYSASERGLTINQAAITGKCEFPWQSNSPQNPLSDLLTCRPGYSVGPVVSSQECFNGASNSSNALSLLSNQFGSVVSSQECFNGVSDSSNALSLLSNQPWDGPKSRLGVNSFLGQPPDNNPGAAIGELGLGQRSVVQFDKLDQVREYDSPPVGQHMHQ